MVEDIWLFLNRFSVQELRNLRVLIPHSGSGYLLRASSIGPLVELMKHYDITRLEKVDKNWFLTSGYEFQNPGSKEHRWGDARTLKNPGNVFNQQNPNINPYFKKRSALYEFQNLEPTVSLNVKAEGQSISGARAEQPGTQRPVSNQISELIRGGECETLEFKSTLQWDVVGDIQNKGLRDSSLKTLVAFMNSEGGTLLIGVEDNGNIFGLEKDISIARNSEDGFIQLVSSLIHDRIGPQYFPLIKYRIDKIDEKLVCVIDVAKSSEPTFLDGTNGKEFYIRAGNTSRPLDPQQTVAYINTRFRAP